MIKVSSHQLFPTFFGEYKNENEQSHKRLYDSVEDIYKEHGAGRVISNVGGWQSNSLDDKYLNESIGNFVLDSAYDYLLNYQVVGDIKVTIVEHWLNINKMYSINTSHHHVGFGVDFACVYYLKVPKDAGCLRLEDATSFGKHASFFFTNTLHQYNSNIAPVADYYPKEGHLVIFPAYIMHCVLPSLIKSNEERWSYALNLRVDVREGGN